jgi:hypothetical protein
MTTENTKFADLLKNVSTIDKAKLLDQISASASSLPAADLKVLIQALSAEVRALESKTSKKAARLAKLSAAMEATDNGTFNNVAVVRGELRRLGLGDINAKVGEGYDVHEMDAKMKAAGWDTMRKMQMKSRMDSLGLLVC